MKLNLRSVSSWLKWTLLDNTWGTIVPPSKGVHLMNSHLLTRDKKLDSDYFDHQLKQLSKKSTIIPFEEAIELIQNRKNVNHSLIAFSYDDGYAECYSHIAPVLERYNGYGCFFVNPNFVEGDEQYIAHFLKNAVSSTPPYKMPMRWNELAELQKRGHIIGAHTMDHVCATSITNIDELDYQIGACKKRIETKINTVCDYFAFTYGIKDVHFNEKCVDIAEKYYKYVFGASHSQQYFSYNGRIFNRRHCEPFWKVSHINYFLSKKIKY